MFGIVKIRHEEKPRYEVTRFPVGGCRNIIEEQEGVSFKMKKLFITGTDTGVGKTLVAAGLLHALAQQGKRVLGVKPLASGAEMTPQGARNDDALLLQSAMNVEVPYETVNPLLYEQPMAPHLAAQSLGQTLSVEALMASMQPALAIETDYTVVEGVGGWLVPLNPRETVADFAKTLGFDVILVVGMRLGCLNHALLTHQAMVAAGLHCAGWVANIIDNNMLALEENLADLQGLLPVPLLARVPFLEVPTPEQAATYFSELP